MDRQQALLLYEIADAYWEQFCNNMKDSWDYYNYTYDHEISMKIEKLEREYKNKYGQLPEWKTINDVLQAKKEISNKLNEE